MNNALHEYTETNVAGEGQLKLTIMLYEGAVRFLTKAKENIEQHRVEDSYINLVKAKRIVIHLMSTTNPDSSDLAMNLHKLYVFLYERITMANIQKSVAEIEAALRIINKLLEGWHELEAQQAHAMPQAHLAQPQPNAGGLSLRV